MAFLAGLFQTYAAKIIAGLAIAAAVAGVLLKVYSAGKAAARVDGLTRQISNAKVRTDVENNVARARPADRQRLRDKWTRG